MQKSSEECVARVREVSEAFQQVYLEEEPPEQPVNVHLLPYPIQVDLSHIENCLIQNQVLKVSRVQVESDGAVNALPGWENFPDTQVPLSLSSSGVHWGWDFVSNQLLASSASILSHSTTTTSSNPTATCEREVL